MMCAHTYNNLCIVYALKVRCFGRIFNIELCVCWTALFSKRKFTNTCERIHLIRSKRALSFVIIFYKKMCR